MSTVHGSERRVVLAIDWSGDAGINPKKVPARPTFLGLAVVAYADEAEVEEILHAVRRDRRLAPRHEFHFADENPGVRTAFMAALARAPITVATAVVDKTQACTCGSWAWGTGDDLLHELMLQCIEQMPREVVEEAVVLIDGNKSAKPFCTCARKVLTEGFRAGRHDYRIDRVKPSESQRTPGVMIADMLAGAARYAALCGQPTYLDPVKKKITAQIHLP
jgi:hypothetical protein